MDDDELISIEPDDKVRYSNDSWNTEDFTLVDPSIIGLCKDIIAKDEKDPELDVKLDNLAFLLANLKNYYSILSEYHPIQVQHNSAIRDADKDQKQIHDMLNIFNSEEVTHITINFGYKGEPVKIENSIIIDEVFKSLRRLSHADLTEEYHEAEDNISKASVRFTNSCLEEIRDFLEEHTDVERTEGYISNRQCRIIAKIFKATNSNISKNQSFDEKFIRRRLQLIIEKRNKNLD